MPIPLGLAMLGSAAIGAAGNIIGNRNQLNQQQKLTNQQVEAQMRLGRFNQQLGMETWEATNYAAQRAQMEKAGLNVGLMYGGQGHGGTISTPQAGSVTGGQANPNAIGMGLQTGLNALLQKAQIGNIEADTKLKQVEATKKEGVDTEATETAITALKQSTQNAEIQAKILEYEAELKRIEANKANMTQDEIIKQTAIATEKLTAEATSAKVKATIDEKTEKNIIQLAQQVNNEMTVKIESGKAGIEQTKASTEQTKQTTTNLKQDEIEKTLHNQLRANGIEPKDSAPMRIASRFLKNAGTSLEKMQAKMQSIIAWLKGENGQQTTERFEEIWNK